MAGGSPHPSHRCWRRAKGTFGLGLSSPPRLRGPTPRPNNPPPTPRCEESTRTISAQQLLPAKGQKKGGGKGTFPLPPGSSHPARERRGFARTGEKEKTTAERASRGGKRKDSGGRAEGQPGDTEPQVPPGRSRHHPGDWRGLI